jgi:hypothetical protein
MASDPDKGLTIAHVVQITIAFVALIWLATYGVGHHTHPKLIPLIHGEAR